MSIYDYQVRTIDGSERPMSEYRDQALLIVNVASKCGFTPQYQGLESLYQKFKDRRFTVLGFPCNQFGHQEPGNETEIQSFCEVRFGVTFPLFAKIDVNGNDADPLWKFLKKKRPGLLGTEAIKWNFTKFLVDRHGAVIERYGPRTEPAELSSDVDKVLK